MTWHAPGKRRVRGCLVVCFQGELNSTCCEKVAKGPPKLTGQRGRYIRAGLCRPAARAREAPSEMGSLWGCVWLDLVRSKIEGAGLDGFHSIYQGHLFFQKDSYDCMCLFLGGGHVYLFTIPAPSFCRGGNSQGSIGDLPISGVSCLEVRLSWLWIPIYLGVCQCPRDKPLKIPFSRVHF